MPETAMNGSEVRRVVRDAMDRLLDGKPIRSDGKLTIKSLAAEAGVKRWILTHQQRDLQQEFRDRCATQNKTPESQKDLLNKLDEMKQQIEKYKVRTADLSEENSRLARVIQVLTLENLNLKEKVDVPSNNISHLR